jgi:hypothetical protein
MSFEGSRCAGPRPFGALSEWQTEDGEPGAGIDNPMTGKPSRALVPERVHLVLKACFHPIRERDFWFILLSLVH